MLNIENCICNIHLKLYLYLYLYTYYNIYLTIRLRARNFYEVIVNGGEARVDYRFIEIDTLRAEPIFLAHAENRLCGIRVLLRPRVSTKQPV